MDTVRFGRALGTGARAAARTLVEAADAARAEPRGAGRGASPAAPGGGPGSPREQMPTRIGNTPRAGSAGSAAPVKPGVRAGLARFREAAVRPMVRLSGALLLEVAGVFFGVFALFGLNTMLRAWP